MSVLYLFLLALIIIVTKQRLLRFFRVNVVFSAIWLIAAIAASAGIYGLKPISFNIQAFVLVVVLVFNIIYIAISCDKNVQTNQLLKVEFVNCVNRKNVVVLSIIGVGLFTPVIVESIKHYAQGYNISEIRFILFASESRLGLYQAFFFRNIPLAIFYAVSLLAIVDKFQSKSNKLLSLMIFNIVVSFLTLGGRYMIVNPIYYVIGYLAVGLKFQVNKKFLVVSILMGIVLLVLSTTVREQQFTKSTVMYYAGSLSYLDLILKSPAKYGFTNSFLSGKMMFGFVVDPVLLVLKVLFGISTKVPSYHLDAFVHDFANIGQGSEVILFNSNVSMLFPALKDFGYFGIVVYPAFLAGLVAITERLIARKQNLFYLTLFIYLASALFNSLVKYGLLGSDALIIVFSLAICTLKNEGRGTSIGGSSEI